MFTALAQITLYCLGAFLVAILAGMLARGQRQGLAGLGAERTGNLVGLLLFALVVLAMAR